MTRSPEEVDPDAEPAVVRPAALRLLNDARILPSATSIRFAVLVVVLVASTGSIYGALGLILNPGLRQTIDQCTAGLSDRVAHGGFRNSGSAAVAAMRCQNPHLGVIAAWTVVGIAIVMVAALVTYAITPWWLIYLTRPWLPVGRDEEGRRTIRRPWWLPGGDQRLEPLRRDYADQREMEDRVVHLAAVTGLRESPRCRLHRYRHDTGARAFDYRGHGYLRLNVGLTALQVANPAAFDGIILHELAHLKNKDSRPAFLTYAAWRAFLALAFMPYIVALAFHPETMSTHVVASVAVLTALTYVAHNAVLRARETHADAGAWLVDPAAMAGALDAPSLQPSARRRHKPAALATHPTLRRRIDDLGKPAALSPTDGLALFSAGIGVAGIATNLQWTVWFLTASPTSPLGHGFLAKTAAASLTGRPGPTYLMELVVLLPPLLAALPLIVGLAAVMTWRTALAEQPRSGRVPVLRRALPLAVGYLIGEPMSIVYSNMGFWSVWDSTLAWEIADVAASAAILGLLLILIFWWSAESATTWLPATRGSLRRMCVVTTLVGTVGAAPVFLMWLLFHTSQDVLTMLHMTPNHPIDTWPLAAWTGRWYLPVVYLNALPAGILLMAVPALFTLGATLRRRRLPLAHVLWGGVIAAAATIVLGLGFVVGFRELVGAGVVDDARPYGVYEYLYGVVIWIAAAVSGLAGVAVSVRSPRTRLSSALATAFLSSALAAPFLTLSVFIGACGASAGSCFSTEPKSASIIYGRIGAEGPLYAAIVTIFLVAAAKIGSRLRRRRPAPNTATAEGAGIPNPRLGTIAIVLITIGLAAGTYASSRYILFR